MTTILAVDGGNSKTDVVLSDAEGALLSHVRGPGCSPDTLGVVGSVGVITSLVDLARAAAMLPFELPASSAVLLLAGVDRPEQETQMLTALAPHSLADDLVVSNDTFAVLRAGSRSGCGVAVVCGAGLNALGVTPGGVVGRYQALGELSGDWGGGQSVGLAALGAAIRGEDGRGPNTVLTEAVCHRLEVMEPQNVAVAIHEERWDEQVLVDLAPVVFAAADAGDSVATDLIVRLSHEVAGMAVGLLRRLRLDEDPTCVVLGGGMLQAQHGDVIRRVTDIIMAAAPRAEVRVLDVPPVVGAVRTGLKRLGLSPEATEIAIERLVDSLNSAGQSREESSP